MKRSPTLEGFKAIFRQPSFGLAEIAWRWSVGAAAISLLALAFIEYLDTLPVADGDLLLLRSGQPVFVGRALQHIFRGSAPRVLEAGLLLGIALAVAWIIAASLGRAASLKVLLKYFEERAGLVPEGKPWSIRSLYGLNFFRVINTLAAKVGFVGAILFGGFVTSEKDPSPGSAMLIFFFVLMLVMLAWLVVNWFLSLASVFVVAQGEDTFGAIGAAATLFRQRPGAVIAASFWFGLAHLVAWFIASSAIGFPLAFLTVLPGGVVFGGVLLITLLYFAIVDFFYVGRLAAYLAIAEAPNFPPVPETIQPAPQSPPASRIDPDELILSDLPLAPQL